MTTEQLNQAEGLRQSLDDELSKARSDTAELEEEKERLAQALREAREAADSADTQLEQAVQARHSLDDELSSTTEALTRFTDEKEQLQQKLAKAHQAIEGKDAQLKAQEGLQYALQMDLDLSRRAIEELKQRLDEWYAEPDHEDPHDVHQVDTHA